MSRMPESTDLMTNLSLDITSNSSMSEDSSELLRSFTIFLLEGCTMPLIGLIGILGNLLSLRVLQRHKALNLKPGLCHLLSTLCCFDLLLILVLNIFYALPVWLSDHGSLRRLLLYCTPLLLFVTHVGVTGSIYAIVAVALERYCIICQPKWARSTRPTWLWDGQGSPKASVVITALIALALGYNVNKLFEVRVEHQLAYQLVFEDHTVLNVTAPVVVATSLRRNGVYTQTLILVNFMLMTLLPLILLSISHFLIYKHIRRSTLRRRLMDRSSRNRRDNAMATLFFIIVVFFIICHSGKVCLNLFEIRRILFGVPNDAPWPLWAFILSRINHALLVVNSSVNFFIYCFRDARFRDALITLLGFKREMDPGNSMELHRVILRHPENGQHAEVSCKTVGIHRQEEGGDNNAICQSDNSDQEE